MKNAGRNLRNVTTALSLHPLPSNNNNDLFHTRRKAVACCCGLYISASYETEVLYHLSFHTSSIRFLNVLTDGVPMTCFGRLFPGRLKKFCFLRSSVLKHCLPAKKGADELFRKGCISCVSFYGSDNELT